jgi:thiamine transport system ATP-binding protein
MSGLELRDLVVSYSGVAAVDGVTLDVAAGEIVALLGPSGCGKSTLLRAVAGLEPIDAGTVAWEGSDLSPVPVHRRGFGLLFQDGQLFPHRDVAGNVEFGLRMAGVDRRTRAERTDALLDLVGLGGRHRRSVTTLSGGEQQRVALARALAPKPRLLLLDEPMSALDRSLRERLTSDLHDILRATGTSALYVTHDHDEAFALADRIAVMDAGRLLQTAPPAQLWRHPADEQVARFLGFRYFVPALALGDAAPRGLDAATTLALRPGSLVPDPAGPLTGQVLARRPSRGGTALMVLVPGLGEVGAWSPGPLAVAVATGTQVRLRLEEALTATVGDGGPASEPEEGPGRGEHLPAH